MWGHIWGHKSESWGHIAASLGALRPMVAPIASLKGVARPRCAQAFVWHARHKLPGLVTANLWAVFNADTSFRYPPSKTRAHKNLWNRSVSGLGLPDFYRPPTHGLPPLSGVVSERVSDFACWPVAGAGAGAELPPAGRAAEVPTWGASQPIRARPA